MVVWMFMLQLYKSLWKLFLDFCFQFLSPGYRKDTIKLERVQRIFVWILSGLKGLSFGDRLNRLSYQFAYCHERSTADAISLALHSPRNILTVKMQA